MHLKTWITKRSLILLAIFVLSLAFYFVDRHNSGAVSRVIDDKLSTPTSVSPITVDRKTSQSPKNPLTHYTSEKICLEQCEEFTQYQSKTKLCESSESRCAPDDVACRSLPSMQQKNRCLFKAYQPFDECTKSQCGV